MKEGLLPHELDKNLCHTGLYWSEFEFKNNGNGTSDRTTRHWSEFRNFRDFFSTAEAEAPLLPMAGLRCFGTRQKGLDFRDFFLLAKRVEISKNKIAKYGPRANPRQSCGDFDRGQEMHSMSYEF